MGRPKLHIELTPEEEYVIICLREPFWRMQKANWRTNNPRIVIEYGDVDTCSHSYLDISKKTKNGLWRKKLIRRVWTDAYRIIYTLTDLGKAVKLSTDRLDSNDPLYRHTEYGRMDKYIADHKTKRELRYNDYTAVLKRITKHEPLVILNELHRLHSHWNFHKFVNHFVPNYYQELSLFSPPEKPKNGFHWYQLYEYGQKETALLFSIQLLGFIPKYVAEQKKLIVQQAKAELGRKNRFKFLKKLKGLGIHTIQQAIVAHKKHIITQQDLKTAYTLIDPFFHNQGTLCAV